MKSNSREKAARIRGEIRDVGDAMSHREWRKNDFEREFCKKSRWLGLSFSSGR